MRHVSASLGANAASLRAIAAVIHAVLGAFRATDLADFGAQGADLGGKLGAARQLAGGQRANFGATAIELDAARHHVDVGLS